MLALKADSLQELRGMSYRANDRHRRRAIEKLKGKQVTLSMCVSETIGSLNPTWVEWLMGYPSGWTDLEDSETP
jgi:hypothetical protein